MMTLGAIRRILARVEFQDWGFKVEELGPGFSLQAIFYARDNDASAVERHFVLQKGRKWYVSPHSTVGEVIQTAFKAVISAMEHEVREQFLVDGKVIFGPHMDIEQLLKIADNAVERNPLPPLHPALVN